MVEKILNRKEKIFDLWSFSYDWLFPSVFYQAVHLRLLEYVNLPENPEVLDLGCGTGQLLNRLATKYPDLRGKGLDLSAQMIRQARQRNCHRPRLIYIKGNAAELPFAERQFDAVFNTLSFLHYPLPEQVFQEVSRVLRPNGKFYLVDITTLKRAESHLNPVTVMPGNIRFYSSQSRENLGKQAGLRCLGHYYLLGLVMLTIFAK